MEDSCLNSAEFSSRPIERVLVLRAHSGLAVDERFAAALTEQMALARAEGYTRVVFDLECLVNCTGLGACFVQEALFRKSGGRMAFFTSDPRVRAELKVMKSDVFFFDSEPEALVYVLYETRLFTARPPSGEMNPA
jgi:anti-anti-sigma regulatory factor